MEKYVNLAVILILFKIIVYSQGIDSLSDAVPNDIDADMNVVAFPDTTIDMDAADTVESVLSNTEELSITVQDSSGVISDSVFVNDTILIRTKLDSLGRSVLNDTNCTVSELLREPSRDKKRRNDDVPVYAGTSKDMDQIASEIVLDAYRGKWNDVNRGLERLQRLEKRRELVKISKLLNVSVRYYRLEQNEFFNESERMTIEKELDSCITDGFCYTDALKKNRLAIHELIHCGIKGFQASRMIVKNPIEAAIEGYAVVVRLEKLLQADSTMYDAFMGLGLFYCSVAGAPSVIRAALALTGRQVTLEKGLSYLRISAQKGHYVNIPSLVYLTQFLSPYLGHHVMEKDSIFTVLQKKCHPNPRYLFEQIDEHICFHPEKFTLEYIADLRKAIAEYKNTPLLLRSYFELMKYQYCDYIDTLNCPFKKDPDVKLKEFLFYPLFMTGLRTKELCMINSIGNFARIRSRDCEKYNLSVISMLEKSSMASTKRDVYKWRIRDAFRLR
ncbi:MAG: hypothetical protein JW915_10750 [Chitinispirillaceae bacterium]|nr:hypothetical protein [Chitinispirillaceae bacterium]